jgi:exonuclease SbcC
MIIKEIDLENIRSHISNRISFTEGINVITGNTGSGKSTLLMATQYALFGKIGEGQGEGKLLLRRGENSGSITLRFTENGSEYLVRRGLKKFKDTVRNDDSKNEVFKDEKIIDLQNRAADLNAYILKILKIESPAPTKAFEAITYIKQDELKDLIFETGQSKQEHVDQLLQLNRYADAYDELKEVTDKIKNELDVNKIEESLTGDENEIIKIESRISHLNSLNLEAQKSLETFENELKNNKIKLNDSESEIKFYREKRNEFTKLITGKNEKILQIGRFEKQLSEIKKEIETKEIETITIDENKEIELKATIVKKELDKRNIIDKQKTVYETLCKLESEQDSETKRVSQLKEEIKRLQLQNEGFNREIITIKDLLEKARSGPNEDETNGRIVQLKSFIDGLKTERAHAIKTGICVLCGQNLVDKQHLEKEYKQKISSYEKIVSQLIEEQNKNVPIKTRKDLELNYNKLNVKISENSERIKSDEDSLKTIDLNEISKKTDVAKKEYEELSKITKSVETEIDSLRREIDKINELKTISNELKIFRSKKEYLEAELLKTREEFSLVNEDIIKLDFKQDELERKENELNEITKVINSLSSNLAGIKGEIETRKLEISDNESKLEESKTKIKKKEELRKIVDKKERFLTLMENLRHDIRDIREYVRNRFIKEFKTLFQTRFLEIRNESDYTIDIDNNYNVKVIAGNEVLDAKTLSGGEKTSVALAYRMALSSIASMLGGMNKNESLLMDEPTSGLDKEDINALSTCITKIKDLNQIIIVTHEDTMKNIADNLITITKTSGESKVYSSK